MGRRSRSRALGCLTQPPMRIISARKRRASVSLGIEDTVEVLFEAIFVEVGDAAAADVIVLGDVGGIVHGIGEGFVLASAEIGAGTGAGGTAGEEEGEEHEILHSTYDLSPLNPHPCPLPEYRARGGCYDLLSLAYSTL